QGRGSRNNIFHKDAEVIGARAMDVAGAAELALITDAAIAAAEGRVVRPANWAAIEQIDDYRAVTAQAKGVPAIRPDVDRPRREKICDRAANDFGSLELAGIGSVNH